MDNSTLVTKTFIKQVEGLLNTGAAATYAEIADSLDWDRTSMTSVIKGRRNVPVAVYRRFTEHYNLLAPEFNGQDETENALIREQFLKDDLIAALKQSNQFFRDKEDLSKSIKTFDTNLKKTNQDILANANLLAALIEISLLLAQKKGVYKQSVDILEKRKLKSSFV